MRTIARRRGFRSNLDGFMPLTLAVAVAAVGVVGWLAQALADPQAHAAALERYADELVERDLAERGWLEPGPPLLEAATAIERSQGVQLLAPLHPFRLELMQGVVTARPPPEPLALRAAAIVARELERFPPRSLGRARFRRVLLCAGLAEAGKPIPSLPNYQQTLLLDVESTSAFLRRLVHHELFHFIDFADDDQVMRDPTWDALNDRYFVYGAGGRSMREPGSSRLTRDLPGFVSLYATAAIEEDKAETFSFLMTHPAELAGLAVRDPVVRRKMAAVQRQVSARLPELDPAFFAAVADGRR